jgi:dihydroflavonol-4-reductase
MKVLVTGANGFLASNIVRELIRHEADVRALVRPAADLTSLKGTDCELFYGHITEMTDVVEAVRDCNVVIHAAAETSHSYKGYQPYMEVNVNGTRNMLEASCKWQVKKFIFVSTANTFGYGTRDYPGNEETPARYPFTLSGYAISKSKAQELVLKYAQDGRLNATVVNPTFMIGPFDSKPSSGKIITMMHGRRFVPVPPGGKNFVHVADVAKGIYNAIEKGKNGSCYLLAHENLSYAEFFTKVGLVSGKSFRKIKLSPLLLEILGIAGETLGLFRGRSDLNRLNARILCVENYYSSARAVKELDMPQTPIDQAIVEAIEWFDRYGYLGKKVY